MKLTIILAAFLLVACTPLAVREQVQPTISRSELPQQAAAACIERNAQNSNLVVVKRPGTSADAIEIIVSIATGMGMDTAALIDVTPSQELHFRRSPSLWAGDSFRLNLIKGC
jgi:hypothetical protein